MGEVLKKGDNDNIVNLSGNIEEVRFNYNDLLLTGLLGVNSNDPAKLVDELINYRKTH